MKKNLRETCRRDNTARNAWIAFGAVVALGVIVITVREIPSMRREIKLLRM
jgi:hypothetical protein